MDKLKWGLIGCGDISQKRVAPALRDLDNCELTAINRAKFKLAEPFAKEFGAKKIYKNWKDLCNDDEINAVYIATPVYMHAEQTIYAAKAGKHVLVEKPMALSAKECNKMIKVCKKNNVKLGVSYFRRFFPVIDRIKEIIKSGEIGTPVLAEINIFMSFNVKPGEARSWLLNKKLSGGGPMMDFGCHRIEVLQNIFGKVKNIKSETFKLRFDREVEDTAYVSILFENNVQAILRACHAVYEAEDTFNIYGTKGSIKMPILYNGNICIKTNKGEKFETLPPAKNTHMPLIDNFVKSVFENTNPGVNGEIGRDVAIVLDSIYKR